MSWRSLVGIQIILRFNMTEVSYEEQNYMEKAVTHPRIIILLVLADFHLLTEKLKFEIFH